MLRWVTLKMGFSLNNPELILNSFFYQLTLKGRAPRTGDRPESQALLCRWLAISLGKSLTNLDLSFSGYEMELMAFFPPEGGMGVSVP